MAFAYFLLGLVVMYGVYWTVKYIMLPPPEKDTASDKPETKHHVTKHAPTKSKTGVTAKSPTTKGTQYCQKAGYEYHKKSGYCYRFSTTPLTWPEARAACESEKAALTTARIRRDQNASEEFVQKMFRERSAKVSGNNKNYAAVGLFSKYHDLEGGSAAKVLDAETTYTEEEFYILERTMLFAHHPMVTDVVYDMENRSIADQDFVFMNRQGQLYFFLDNFKGPFICEYIASETKI